MSEPVDLENLSPDRQLAGFAETNLIGSLMGSAVIHVLVIGLASLTFLLAWQQGGEETAADESTEKKASADGDGKVAPAQVPSATPAGQPPGGPAAGPAGAGAAGAAAASGAAGAAPATGSSEDPRVVNRDYVEGMKQQRDPAELRPTSTDLGLDLGDL